MPPCISPKSPPPRAGSLDQLFLSFWRFFPLAALDKYTLLVSGCSVYFSLFFRPEAATDISASNDGDIRGRDLRGVFFPLLNFRTSWILCSIPTFLRDVLS